MDSALMEKLKPCPFCGKLPVLVRGQGNESYVDCETPFCAAEGINAPSEEAWNRRALQAAVPQWVATKERLPEIGQTVIVCGTETNGERASWAVTWHQQDDDVNERWLARWEVTHWMAVPPLPPVESAT